MKYRKRPLYVEAAQFWPDKKPWPSGVYSATEPHTVEKWAVGTDGHRHVVRPGDYIVTDAHGFTFPIQADVFEAAYEPAPPEPPKHRCVWCGLFFQALREHAAECTSRPTSSPERPTKEAKQ